MWESVVEGVIVVVAVGYAVVVEAADEAGTVVLADAEVDPRGAAVRGFDEGEGADLAEGSENSVVAGERYLILRNRHQATLILQMSRVV